MRLLSCRPVSRLAATLGLGYERLMDLANYPVPAAQPGGSSVLDAKLAGVGLTETEERSVAAFVQHLLAQRESG